MTETPTLTIDELSGIFKALRENDSETGLEQALETTIALAKAKGMGVAEFVTLLEATGIEMTDDFRQWLEQKY